MNPYADAPELTSLCSRTRLSLLLNLLVSAYQLICHCSWTHPFMCQNSPDNLQKKAVSLINLPEVNGLATGLDCSARLSLLCSTVSTSEILLLKAITSLWQLISAFYTLGNAVSLIPKRLFSIGSMQDEPDFQDYCNFFLLQAFYDIKEKFLLKSSQCFRKQTLF